MPLRHTSPGSDTPGPFQSLSVEVATLTDDDSPSKIVVCLTGALLFDDGGIADLTMSRLVDAPPNTYVQGALFDAAQYREPDRNLVAFLGMVIAAPHAWLTAVTQAPSPPGAPFLVQPCRFTDTPPPPDAAG